MAVAKINFTHKLSHLSRDQYKQLIQRLFIDENRDKIMTEMMWYSISQNNADFEQIINDNIQSIITESTNQSMACLSSKNKFSMIAAKTISHIGSFLPLKDLLNLEIVNKDALIAIRISHPALRELSMYDTFRLANIRTNSNSMMQPQWQRFLGVTKMDISASDFLHAYFSNALPVGLCIFQNIEKLFVSCTNCHDIKHFLNLCNVDTLYQVHLLIDREEDTTIESAQHQAIALREAILSCRHLKILRISGCTDFHDQFCDEFGSKLSADEIRNSLPKLNAIYTGWEGVQLLKKIAFVLEQQIESLFIHGKCGKNDRTVTTALLCPQCDDTHFLNLREMSCIEDDASNLSSAILDLGKLRLDHLERIALGTSCGVHGNSTNSKSIEEEAQSILSAIFNKCKLKAFKFVPMNLLILDQMLMSLKKSSINGIGRRSLEVIVDLDNIAVSTEEESRKVQSVLIDFFLFAKVYLDEFSITFKNYGQSTFEIDNVLSRSIDARFEVEYVMFHTKGFQHVLWTFEKTLKDCMV